MLEPYLEKFPAEGVIFHIDCTPMLADDEIITSTPEMGFLPALTGPNALTFEGVVVNTEAVAYPDNVQVAPGKAIQVRIAGGLHDPKIGSRAYAVLSTFSTSKGNTMVARAILRVLNPAPGPA